MNSSFASLSLVATSLAVAACSSSSPTAIQDAGVQHPADTGARTDSSLPLFDAGNTHASDTGTPTNDAGGGKDSGPPTATTTIADVRQNNPSGSFTVEGFVTALAGGKAGDFPQWYIEDPKGGPYSGIVVYCDPDVSKACLVPEPALHDLILVTGSLDPYKGQLEIAPTAMTVVQSNATPPPVETLTAMDVAPSGNSPYRGVFVTLSIAAPMKLVVDSVTPAVLADSACGATFADGGVASCTTACEPPVYSGFRANDGAGNEVYVEAPFFLTDPLQSSPECLAQSGVVAVKVGTAFTAMSGILDLDPYAAMQALSPVLQSDYAISP